MEATGSAGLSSLEDPLVPPVESGRESEDSYFRKQLVTARSEISNLRQQIRALSVAHKQDIEKIKCTLNEYQQNGCTCSANSVRPVPSASTDDESLFRPIGVVSTWFPEKRATPRQPGICIGSHGKLTLSNSLFTNPEHALEGLNEYSHMWILFHFHKNDSTHIRAKVAPPRLNGVRTGVFGTRSPHRPSPIGLSLVKIDKVEGSCVYFSGVDMVDGTPVLDIKPYIPQYDNPTHCSSLPELRLMDGGEEESDASTSPLDISLPPSPLRNPQGNIGEREAPDGEEGARSALAAPVSTTPQVRVPAWINQSPVSKLSVVFSERAEAQLDDIDRDPEAVASLRNSISCVLQEDPRSVYLREKWGNQFFTFLINGLHVSCKFDDSLHTATVFQVKSAGKMCECGQPEWQCTLHGDTN